jgi:arginine utilization regulatory protein
MNQESPTSISGESVQDILTKIENYVDGIMIVDENGIIRYNKQYGQGGFVLNERESVGRTPMDVYPNLDEETSTCYRALKYGETTTNQLQRLVHKSGNEEYVIDNTFPIIEHGRIIGAVSTSKFVKSDDSRGIIDLSNMTSTYTHNMFTVTDIIGESNVMQDLKYKIHRLSETSSSVLIHGDTGVGKELVAQAIHSSSIRRSKPFVSQNCAAIPHTLLESIFFGTTKGSYTGAENKPGIIELASGGTIFLDELNSMDLNMQAKLLRAIEEKKVTRVGGSESKFFDVRIIAAINENPLVCIKEGRIRKYLYYRLAGIQLRIPSLSERTEDIPILTDHFIKRYNSTMKKNIKGISNEVHELFKAYPWPGNIRELKNIVEAAFNFVQSDLIELGDLPEFIANSNAETPEIDSFHSLPEAVENFEKQFILSSSREASNLTELADLLGISRQSLGYKIKKYELERLFR